MCGELVRTQKKRPMEEWEVVALNASKASHISLGLSLYLLYIHVSCVRNVRCIQKQNSILYVRCDTATMYDVEHINGAKDVLYTRSTTKLIFVCLVSMCLCVYM